MPNNSYRKAISHCGSLATSGSRNELPRLFRQTFPRAEVIRIGNRPLACYSDIVKATGISPARARQFREANEMAFVLFEQEWYLSMEWALLLSFSTEVKHIKRQLKKGGWL